MLRFDCRSLRQLPAIFGLGFVLSFSGGVASAITREQAASLTAESGNEFSDGAFILPNEPQFAKFASAVRGLKGTFIGVGTFRVLAAASYGNFDQVLFTDLDRQTVEFNARQISALVQSESLPEFLAAILKRPDLADEIKDALRDDRYISASSKTPLALTLMVSPSREAKYVHSVMSMALDDSSPSFLKSEAAFHRLRAIALAGRMHSIAVDLSGSETLRKIGEHLRAEHSTVGVLDVSNAPDYIHHSGAAWPRFVANLRALPFNANAVVSSTNRYHTRSVGTSVPWAYDSTPAHEYIELASRLKYGSAYEIVDFTRDLARLNNVRACRDLFR